MTIAAPSAVMPARQRGYPRLSEIVEPYAQVVDTRASAGMTGMVPSKLGAR